MLECALREHPAERPVNNGTDQPRNGVKTRKARAECPGGVLTEESAVTRQQSGEHLVGFFVEDLAEGMHGGDGSDLVVAGESTGEDANSSRASIATGDKGEFVGRSHRVNDVFGGAQLVERGLDSHVKYFRSAEPTLPPYWQYQCPTVTHPVE